MNEVSLDVSPTLESIQICLRVITAEWALWECHRRNNLWFETKLHTSLYSKAFYWWIFQHLQNARERFPSQARSEKIKSSRGQPIKKAQHEIKKLGEDRKLRTEESATTEEPHTEKNVTEQWAEDIHQNLQLHMIPRSSKYRPSTVALVLHTPLLPQDSGKHSGSESWFIVRR